MPDDDPAQFPPKGMARHDAEIAADIGDDRADRPAADLGGDLLRRGQKGEATVGLVGGPGGGWLGRTLDRRPGNSISAQRSPTLVPSALAASIANQ
jgi:hypothetical protein